MTVTSLLRLTAYLAKPLGRAGTHGDGGGAEEAGVEPTEDAWRPPTGLKPARVTGPDALPRPIFAGSLRRIKARSVCRFTVRQILRCRATRCAYRPSVVSPPPYRSIRGSGSPDCGRHRNGP